MSLEDLLCLIRRPRMNWELIITTVIKWKPEKEGSSQSTNGHLLGSCDCDQQETKETNPITLQLISSNGPTTFLESVFIIKKQKNKLKNVNSYQSNTSLTLIRLTTTCPNSLFICLLLSSFPLDVFLTYF